MMVRDGWIGRSLALVVLLATVSGASASHVLLSEDFDGDFPATGWEATTSAGDVTWQLTADEAANWTSTTPGRGQAAVADAQSTTQAYDAMLITPVVRLPSAQQLYVRFDTLFETWTGFEAADVDVYSVADDTWTTIVHWTDEELWQGVLSGQMNLSLVDFPDSEVRLRFRYHNDLSGLNGAAFFGDLYWQIDNVDVVAGNIWGDADQNGKVDLDDFVILKTNFGTTGATWMKADFDGDRDVDLDDFVILKNNFGESVVSAPHLPEPITLSLLGLGALALPRRRSKA